MIYIWLYLMYCSAFILWFDHFLYSGAEICQVFRCFFGKFKKIKKTFRNWLTFTNHKFYWTIVVKIELSFLNGRVWIGTFEWKSQIKQRNLICLFTPTWESDLCTVKVHPFAMKRNLICAGHNKGSNFYILGICPLQRYVAIYLM